MERAGNFSFRPLLVYMEYFIYSIFQPLKCNKNVFFSKNIFHKLTLFLQKNMVKTNKQIVNNL